MTGKSLMMVAAGAVFMFAVAGEVCADEILFSEANAAFSFNPHAEFKGASGSIAKEGDGWKIHYDFSGGGHGVGLRVNPNVPFSAENIFFEANHCPGQKMAVQITDSAGQSFVRFAASRPFHWCRYECRLDSGWTIHWNGPNDGVVRQPIVSFEVNVDRNTKGTPVVGEVGDAFVRKIGALAPRSQARAAELPVRYTVTDFRPGDRFSAGPRLFYRTDEPKRTVEDGELEIDFSTHGGSTLLHEIPVWGRPEAFHLTVEAPVEAAGLEFELGFRSGHPFQMLPFGKLPAAGAGTNVIRAVLSAKAPTTMIRSRRVASIAVKRGRAPAKRMKIRLWRLEASVTPGVELPPLLAMPPKGDVPPRELEVAFLNLQPEVRADSTVQVRLRDWQGRDLGNVSARLPQTVPGARVAVWVKLPEVPAGLNFVSYECALYRGDKPDAAVDGWTTSWTRPLADPGSAEKRPDLPWGFGVYLHRTEDFFAYPSGYAVVSDEAAFARMEEKARLAQAMGVKWERAEFQPHVICRDKGVFNFDFYDRLVDCADRHGISLYAVFSHYWPMRGSKPVDQNDLTAYTPENYTNWVETLRQSVARYSGRIAGWEVWNEPNIIGFWKGPKEDYARLVTLAYPAVKGADPAARVLACSTAGVDFKFIDLCIRNKAMFDDISIHPYREDPGERGFMAELVAVTNRSQGTKTWLTELGWPTGCDARTYSERQQAAYYARAYLAAAGSGCCAAINGYDFFDDGFNVQERENNFGIVRRDGTPKPAYRGLAKVFRFFTEGKPSITPQNRVDGSEAWIFRMGGKTALWSEREGRFRVTAAGRANACNLMDEPIGAGETLDVQVGPEAVVFFDQDILSAEEIPAPVAGREMPIETMRF